MTFIFNSYKPMTLARVAVEGLSVHQSLYSSIRPSTSPCIRLFVCTSVKQSVHPSIRPLCPFNTGEKILISL